jgi:DNA-binding NtrC family response regulator
MPKLNDRPLDIEPLAKLFCEKYSLGKKSLSKRFLTSLKNREWKGNIRELENVVQRAVLLSPDKIIDDVVVGSQKAVKTLREIERETILHAMEKFNGNKTLTSRELDIPLRTLHHKLARISGS